MSLRSSEKTRVRKNKQNQTFAYIEMVHEFRRERWGKIQENFEYQKIELYINLNISHKSVCFEFKIF